MDLLPYTKEHHEFRERLKDFCQTHVVPHIDKWEKQGAVDRSVWNLMGERGFLCTAVDTQYGGMGGDFLYSVIALEEVSRTNHYGLDAFLHSDIVVPYITSFGTEEQKQKYLPGCVSGEIVTAVAMTEPDAGSDLASMTMTAVEDGDHVVLNGGKTFISNGLLCDLVVVAAKDPNVDNPHKAVSLYLVEAAAPGFQRGKGIKKLGVNSQDTSELFFNNCRIPKENLLGEKGAGFAGLMQKLQQERLLVALLSVTKAEFALEWTISRYKEAKKTQSRMFELVELSTLVKLGRTFIDKLIVDHMSGEDVTAQTCMAKYWASDMANDAASRCLDMAGDEAIAEACPLVRTFRDLRVARIFAGANEIMKVVIARNMGL